MKPSIIDDKALHLPEGCELWAYSPDTMVLAGPGMDRERYRAIKSDLPAEITVKLIGWRRIAKRAA